MAKAELMKKILSEVSKGIEPDRKVLTSVDSFVKKLNAAIKKNKIKAKAEVGGSIAKGTFLKNDYDVDVFVKFNYSYMDKDISKMLAKILRPFKPESVHGSRDYYQIKGEINFEIIPVLDIKDVKQAKNITDASLFHVKWVKKNSNNKIRNDIRLAKQFCKANRVYGAESYIKGFSGHVLDVLVIHYKGFLNLLKAAVRWKPKMVIDFYGKHKGKALFNLNKSKTHSPLIVIDPVQPERNASAVLDMEKFIIFKQAASRFLKNPSVEDFRMKKFSIEEIRKMADKHKLILLSVTPKKSKEDIMGAKMLKVFEHIEARLCDNGFIIKDSGWNWDDKKKAILWYILDKKELSKEKIQIGPPVKKKEHVDSFKSKHKKTFAKKKRIYAHVKRVHTKPETLISAVVKSSYVKEKIKSIVLKND